MNLQLALRDAIHGISRVVVIQADPDTPLGDVVGALSQFAGTDRLFVGQEPLQIEGRLGDSSLRDGTLVSIGRPPKRSKQRSGWEAVIVGGPDAGRITSLRLGKHVIGSIPGQGVFIDDREVHPRHAEIHVMPDYCRIRALTSALPLTVDGASTFQGNLSTGQVVRLGSTLLEIRKAPIPDADIRVTPECTIEYNRPPRIRPKHVEDARISLPNKPIPQDQKQPFPWMQALLPLVIALGGVLLFGQIYWLMFGLMSPAMVLGTRWEQKRSAKRRDKEETARFRSRVKRMRREATGIAIDKLHELRYVFPDVAMIYDIATEPRKRLWERRLQNNDFLELRVGTTTLESGVTFQVSSDAKEPEPPKLFEAPLTVPLCEVGVLGISGGITERRGVARWLVAQIATLHSPRDVSVMVLTEENADAEWEWMRFLPHAQSRDETAMLAYVACTRSGREELTRWLVTILDERKRQREDTDYGRRDARFDAIVVVLDGARDLRSLSGLPRVMREGPTHDIYFVALDATSGRLPEESDVALLLDEHQPRHARLAWSGKSPVDGVVTDTVAPSWCDEVARALSPLVDSTKDDSGLALPTYSRLTDVLSFDLDSPKTVLEYWQGAGRSTSAVVGEDADGAFSLDLKRDGPHALVAGTTGSGKSEFLQSLIASLAVVNRPESMNFVLIDYKGGSAFSECELLPHTVGMVTNLDGHLTERALTALDAELKRRESELRKIGEPDIESAWSTSPDRAAHGRLGRLVLIIDEFAELVHELPDFVKGLVRIARVGRSLGVHLVLATQRPGGVVSQDIRANTGLRIGLRMEDKEDSREVLDSPDAAEISRATPGRAYARLGSNLSLLPFQTARVAGRRRGNTDGLLPPRLIEVPWTSLARALPVRVNEGDTDIKTDLHFLVSQINVANRQLRLPTQVAPWLPELPTTLVLDRNSCPRGAYALVDVPSEQKQTWKCFDVETASSLAIMGGSRSGRSLALATIAGTLASGWSANDVHLYVMDFGDGSLRSLEALPHCGLVCERTSRDRMTRLIERLNEELDTRRSVFLDSGVSNIEEQRARASDAEKLPYIVVLIDRWEGFLGEFPFERSIEPYDQMSRLVREGVSVGMRMVFSGDRSLLNDRITNLIDERIALKLPNPDDYSLLNLRRSAMPTEMSPGRGIVVESQHELQIAVLGENATMQGQAQVIADIAAQSEKETQVCVPFRLRGLPSTIMYEEVLRAHPSLLVPDAVRPFIGLGGDESEPLTVDLLRDGPFFTVMGMQRTGRSTMAMTMARSVLDAGVHVVCVLPKRSPLESLRDHPNCTIVRGADGDVRLIVEALQRGGEVAMIVVDDLDAADSLELDAFLKDLSRNHGNEIGIVVTGTTEYFLGQIISVGAVAKAGRLGVIFSPRGAYDGEVFGVRLTERLVGPMPKGRGVFCRHGEFTLIQCAR